MVDVSYNITDDDDDGHDTGSAWAIHTNNYSGSGDFTVKDAPSGVWQGGVRFQAVDVPQGATIDSATITLYADGSLSGFDSFTAYGDDVDDAAVWSNSSRPASGFTDTTAGTTNNSPPGAGVTFELEIADCVQDIVDRGGWSALNAMRFRILPAATYQESEIADHDGGHSNEAVLDISYTAGSSGIVIFRRRIQVRTQ